MGSVAAFSALSRSGWHTQQWIKGLTTTSVLATSIHLHHRVSSQPVNWISCCQYHSFMLWREPRQQLASSQGSLMHCQPMPHQRYFWHVSKSTRQALSNSSGVTFRLAIVKNLKNGRDLLATNRAMEAVNRYTLDAVTEGSSPTQAANSDSKETSQVRNIVSKLINSQTDSDSQLQKTVYSEHKLKPLVAFLIEKEISYGAIMGVLQQSPEIVDVPITEWRNTLEGIMMLGFFRRQSMNIINHNPEILRRPQSLQDVAKVLDTLRSAGFTGREVFGIVSRFPEIIHLKKLPKTVETVLNSLLPYFSRSNCMLFLKETPTILLQSEEDIQHKCEYILGKFKVKDNQALKSRFLRFSQLYIETRFEFLHRAGLYEIPDKRGRSSIENPTLRNVVDTGNKYFAKNVAKLTVAEYVAFTEMYAIEKGVTEMREPSGAEDEGWGEAASDEEDQGNYMK